jgi:2-phospho-L-lactate guanylyltransferase
VKAFGAAKRRLSAALPEQQRRALAVSMAERVIAASSPLPVAVVCDDDEVKVWADGLGAIVLSEPGRGLNGAVEAGVEQLAARGFDRIVIAHADLPFAQRLAWVADSPGVTLVPDRHGDGTNVIGIPSRCGFSFSYGPGSFARHCAEAERLGLTMRVVRDADLAADVDTPDDLAYTRNGRPRSATA